MATEVQHVPDEEEGTAPSVSAVGDEQALGDMSAIMFSVDGGAPEDSDEAGVPPDDDEGAEDAEDRQDLLLSFASGVGATHGSLKHLAKLEKEQKEKLQILHNRIQRLTNQEGQCWREISKTQVVAEKTEQADVVREERVLNSSQLYDDIVTMLEGKRAMADVVRAELEANKGVQLAIIQEEAREAAANLRDEKERHEQELASAKMQEVLEKQQQVAMAQGVRALQKQSRAERLQRIEEERTIEKEERYVTCLRDVEALNAQIAAAEKMELEALERLQHSQQLRDQVLSESRHSPACSAGVGAAPLSARIQSARTSRGIPFLPHSRTSTQQTTTIGSSKTSSSVPATPPVPRAVRTSLVAVRSSGSSLAAGAQPVRTPRRSSLGENGAPVTPRGGDRRSAPVSATALSASRRKFSRTTPSSAAASKSVTDPGLRTPRGGVATGSAGARQTRGSASARHNGGGKSGVSHRGSKNLVGGRFSSGTAAQSSSSGTTKYRPALRDSHSRTIPAIIAENQRTHAAYLEAKRRILQQQSAANSPNRTSQDQVADTRGSTASGIGGNGNKKQYIQREGMQTKDGISIAMSPECSTEASARAAGYSTSNMSSKNTTAPGGSLTSTAATTRIQNMNGKTSAGSSGAFRRSNGLPITGMRTNGSGADQRTRREGNSISAEKLGPGMSFYTERSEHEDSRQEVLASNSKGNTALAYSSAEEYAYYTPRNGGTVGAVTQTSSKGVAFKSLSEDEDCENIKLTPANSHSVGVPSHQSGTLADVVKAFTTGQPIGRSLVIRGREHVVKSSSASSSPNSYNLAQNNQKLLYNSYLNKIASSPPSANASVQLSGSPGQVQAQMTANHLKPVNLVPVVAAHPRVINSTVNSASVSPSGSPRGGTTTPTVVTKQHVVVGTSGGASSRQQQLQASAGAAESTPSYVSSTSGSGTQPSSMTHTDSSSSNPPPGTLKLKPSAMGEGGVASASSSQQQSSSSTGGGVPRVGSATSTSSNHVAPRWDSLTIRNPTIAPAWTTGGLAISSPRGLLSRSRASNDSVRSGQLSRNNSNSENEFSASITFDLSRRPRLGTSATTPHSVSSNSPRFRPGIMKQPTKGEQEAHAQLQGHWKAMSDMGSAAQSRQPSLPSSVVTSPAIHHVVTGGVLTSSTTLGGGTDAPLEEERKVFVPRDDRRGPVHLPDVPEDYQFVTTTSDHMAPMSSATSNYMLDSQEVVDEMNPALRAQAVLAPLHKEASPPSGSQVLTTSSPNKQESLVDDATSSQMQCSTYRDDESDIRAGEEADRRFDALGLGDADSQLDLSMSP
ncbi:unnamed protein product [Amoebophrya sp. A25]|nr:unnamed protein product [Amoebophrya sp. A25]|eukprot:GSA25T00017451001.1